MHALSNLNLSRHITNDADIINKHINNNNFIAFIPLTQRPLPGPLVDFLYLAFNLYILL